LFSIQKLGFIGIFSMLELLAWVARHGRYALAGGLLAGFLLPQTAQALRPYLPEMILSLLFLNAFRIGPKDALAGLRHSFSALKITLVLQLVLPMVALCIFSVLGIADTVFGLAILLMLAAPSVTATPNITLLLGHNPEPAFRLLIIGTGILPLTIIPLFWLMPGLGHLADVLSAAFTLLGAIWSMVLLAFALRWFVIPDLGKRRLEALDGFTSLGLAIIVIGLMSAVAPALERDPFWVLQWIVIAMIANLGSQCVVFFYFKKRGCSAEAVPFSVVAGNRNFALFLIALPATITDPLLIFLGCYQVPMYLTAIVMRRIYR
jgi:ACR3 family arsenite transporter